eukprot:2141952-Rhodomonas_salina.2
MLNTAHTQATSAPHIANSWGYVSTGQRKRVPDIAKEYESTGHRIASAQGARPDPTERRHWYYISVPHLPPPLRQHRPSPIAPRRCDTGP